MLGGATKQVNAKKKRMAGWGKNTRRTGVVRGWMVRKVNSEQKKPGRAKGQLSPRKTIAGP